MQREGYWTRQAKRLVKFYAELLGHYLFQRCPAIRPGVLSRPRRDIAAPREPHVVVTLGVLDDQTEIAKRQKGGANGIFLFAASSDIVE